MVNLRCARTAVALVSCAFVLAACARAPGAVHRAGPPRVVSLAPSLTEIAFAIGCGPQVVADTSFDDYPPAAIALPHVADLTHVDVERLATLAPDAVVALHDQEKEGADIGRALNISVVYLPNRGLDDIYADIAGVGAACARPSQAATLAMSLRAQIGAVATRIGSSTPRPRVLYLLGLPGFTAGKGTFLDDVISLAGGVNVAGGVDQPYPDLQPESILALDPDIIIVAKETPFGADVRSRPPWSDLRAVRDGAVYSPPDDDIMERPGPRIVQGIAWLAKTLSAKKT